MPRPLLSQPNTLRANLILPAAGAWDAAPVEIPVAGYQSMVLYCTYERGDAAGAVDIQIQYSPYAEDAGVGESWFAQSLYVAGAVVAGADTASSMQREYTTYTATGAGAETFVYGNIEVGIAVERVRVLARESGVPADPGTFEIIALFGALEDM